MNLLKLSKAEILLDSNHIFVNDDAKKQKRLRQRMSIGWTVFGIIFMLRYIQTEEVFILWSGALIILGHLAVLLLTTLQSTQKEISFNDVKDVKLREGFNHKFMDIYLKSNRQVRVVKTDHTEVVKNIHKRLNT